MSTKAVQQSGDALEEDFLLEDDFNPTDLNSDEEINPDGAIQLAGEEEAYALSDVEDAPQETKEDEPRPSKKAKKSAAAKVEGETGTKRKATDANATVVKAKKAKVKDSWGEDEESIGLLATDALALKLAEKQRRALPNMSSLEMDDVRLLESMIFDSSAVKGRSSLAGFISEAIPILPTTLAKPPKKPGSPRVIVIAGAALRVADLCRDVKRYKVKDIDVAKLFAKHFKLAEHVEYLQKTKVGIAVGTPGRIGKLLEADSLALTHLSHLVLDVTHRDAKKRSLLDMPEGREDLFKLVLGNKAMMDRLREGRMKIVIF